MLTMENIVVGLVVLVLVSVSLVGWRSAWHWIAAKVMGWDEDEKFVREKWWVERAELRAIRQNRKDEEVANDRHRRREGCGLTVFALTCLLRQRRSGEAE